MHGRVKLAKWLERQGLSQVDAARELGTVQSAISRWLAGKAIPRWPVMLKLRKLSGGYIDVNDWADEDVSVAGKAHRHAKAA